MYQRVGVPSTGYYNKFKSVSIKILLIDNMFIKVYDSDESICSGEA